MVAVAYLSRPVLLTRCMIQNDGKTGLESALANDVYLLQHHGSLARRAALQSTLHVYSSVLIIEPLLQVALPEQEVRPDSGLDLPHVDPCLLL